jgi:hypothetical protein
MPYIYSEVQMALSETSERMVMMVKNPPLMPTTTGRELILLPVKAAKRKSGYLTSSGCVPIMTLTNPTELVHDEKHFSNVDHQHLDWWFW